MEGGNSIQYKTNLLVITITFFVLVSIVIIISCGKSFKLPKESDFSLDASVSNLNLKVGDELKVTAIFKNNTSKDYECTSTASFSKSGLIHIYLFKIDEEEKVLTGSAPIVKLKAKQAIQEDTTFKLDKPGKYKVCVSSIFYITDPDKNDEYKYVIKADKIIINCK
ncbi:MAG: hypothetical protein ABFD25_20665 [Clostridiaceae bacterium]